MAIQTLPIAEPIVIASHNPGKLLEIQSLLEGIAQAALSAIELQLPSPQEVFPTFADNATLKAKTASAASGMMALADDSGLCVEILDDQPGIHSSRWAQKTGGWDKAQEELHQQLAQKSAWQQRIAAKLHCSLAIACPNGESRVFSGQVTGELTWPPRGGHGSGFDAMFVPDGHGTTFGEMVPKVKSQLDARFVAFEKLKKELVGSQMNERNAAANAANPGA